MQEIITNSEEETIGFAKKYARELNGGEVIGLRGNLGAGKTVFTKGLALGLGIDKTITSPTFVVMKVYEIKSPQNNIRGLVHIDAYSLENQDEILAIGAQEYFENKNYITVIEWPEKIISNLPANTKYVNIENIEKNRRKLTIK